MYPPFSGVVCREAHNGFCQYHTVDEGLDQSNMVNICESLINLVIVNRRKILIRRPQLVDLLLLGITLTQRLPGNRWHLTWTYIDRYGTRQPRKVANSKTLARLTLRKADHVAGKGGRKKRMLACNESDSGQHAAPKTGADVLLVSHCVKRL